MSYRVLAVPPFDRQLKRLSRKYPSLKSEFDALIRSLADDPKQGTSLGKDCFKVRISIASKGRGKSGGARLITHVVVIRSIVYLLTIYDKSEKSNITDGELRELLSLIQHR